MKKALIASAAVVIVCAFALIAGRPSWTPGWLEAQIRPGPLVGNYNFKVEIEGVTVAGFQSVDGLSAEIEVIEFRDGADPNVVRKTPGRPKWSNITLKKGYINNTELWEWFSSTAAGELEQKIVTLRFFEDEKEIVSYDLRNCWPMSWKAARGVSGSSVPIEEIQFAVESFNRVQR